MPNETLETPQPVQPVEPKPTNWPKMVLTAVLGLALLIGAASAGYWYRTQEISNLKTQSAKPQPKTQNQITPTPTPTPTPAPAQDPTLSWRKISSTRCGFEIRYPDSWYARETKLVSGTDNPEFHYGCVDILSPNYNFEDEQVVGSALPKEFYIKISRTKLGATFKTIVIDSLENYIKSDENIFEPPVNITYETSNIGGISGKEYVSGGFGTFHNFIFRQGNYIFRVFWPVGYEENHGRKDNIGQILPTFKFLD